MKTLSYDNDAMDPMSKRSRFDDGNEQDVLCFTAY